MNIILFHSTNEYRKSSGPPCLYLCSKEKTVLEKQLLELHKAFKNPKITIISDCKPKKIKNITDNFPNISFKEITPDINELYNIYPIIMDIADKCIIINNNIIFNHKIFQNLDKNRSQLFLSNEHVLELGCTLTNNIIQHVSWALPLSWINIGFFCNKELSLLKYISSLPKNKNLFFFEGINWIIKSGGEIHGKLIKNKIKIIKEPLNVL